MYPQPNWGGPGGEWDDGTGTYGYGYDNPDYDDVEGNGHQHDPTPPPPPPLAKAAKRSKTKKRFGGSCCCVTCVAMVTVGIILIAISFRRVEHDELAVTYGKWTKKIGDEVLSEGRHLLYPGVELIRFTRTVVNIEHVNGTGLFCLTSDGVEVLLDVIVQLQIDSEEVQEVIDEFGSQPNFMEYQNSISRDLLRVSCSLYTAEQFYFQRRAINDHMEDFLKKGFPKAGTHSDVRLVQLVAVTLPGSIVRAIEQTQVAVQDSEKALNERGAILIQAETELLRSQKAYDIALINAGATSTAISARMDEQIAQTVEQWKQRTDAFSSVYKAFKMKPGEFLRAYMEAELLLQNDGAAPIVNLPWNDGKTNAGTPGKMHTQEQA
eukprot:TRINITY_DN60629_c0_g1_i1.p1 TRINITY_DN60629_c0_g1~~TRINITY_DN60629_c0_g1_i1.p1  ORF type:complete len:379 (-),score=38.49 TRINITY_DN60629_c0_g1_i1:117-1253(-)